MRSYVRSASWVDGSVGTSLPSEHDALEQRPTRHEEVDPRCLRRHRNERRATERDGERTEPTQREKHRRADRQGERNDRQARRTKRVRRNQSRQAHHQGERTGREHQRASAHQAPHPARPRRDRAAVQIAAHCKLRLGPDPLRVPAPPAVAEVVGSGQRTRIRRRRLGCVGLGDHSRPFGGASSALDCTQTYRSCTLRAGSPLPRA